MVTSSKVSDAHGLANSNTDLAASNDGGKQRCSVDANVFTHGERSAQSERTGVNHPAHMNVVKFVRVRGRRIDEGGLRFGHTLGRTQKCREWPRSLFEDLAAEHLQPRQRRTEDCAPERVEH